MLANEMIQCFAQLFILIQYQSYLLLINKITLQFFAKTKKIGPNYYSV